MRNAIAVVGSWALFACGGAAKSGTTATTLSDKVATPPNVACGGNSLVVKFYDAGQALAALVTLPDGKRILVDTGEKPGRGSKEWHARVMAGLEADIGANGKIDLLWITHQHSDHLGGVPDVIANFQVAKYVHNGTTPSTGVVTDAIAAAKSEAVITVVKPGHTDVKFKSKDVTFTAIVPDAWPTNCDADPNDCSILLRIDYCKSSVLFTGDAEEKEEKLLDVKHATLLQVGHHGSDTSSSEKFIAKVEPTYAVMSPGQPFEGTNKGNCHPIKKSIETLNAKMGGAGTKTIRAFNGKDYGPKCGDSSPADWSDVPANDNIFVTTRDGTIEFSTLGDGKFSVATER